MENDSQCKLILFYLKEYGKITARDAMQLCGCMRLYAAGGKNPRSEK